MPWHKSCYTEPVTSRTVRARLDDVSRDALELLMGEGLNESEAVRTALVEAGDRRRRRSHLAEEVARLAAEAQDTALRLALVDELESASPSWPS
jgi:hypothetical protein